MVHLKCTGELSLTRMKLCQINSYAKTFMYLFGTFLNIRSDISTKPEKGVSYFSGLQVDTSVKFRQSLVSSCLTMEGSSPVSAEISRISRLSDSDLENAVKMVFISSEDSSTTRFILSSLPILFLLRKRATLLAASFR